MGNLIGGIPIKSPSTIDPIGVDLIIIVSSFHDEICEIAREKLQRLDYQADLRKGTDRELPFPKDEFDFLVSWNVIHYKDNEQAIREALREYHRVLKPGG